MKVVPLGDKLVVKRLDAMEKTAGGIVLPDAARSKPQQGRVLSVGDGKLLEEGEDILSASLGFWRTQTETEEYRQHIQDCESIQKDLTHLKTLHCE